MNGAGKRKKGRDSPSGYSCCVKVRSWSSSCPACNLFTAYWIKTKIKCCRTCGCLMTFLLFLQMSSPLPHPFHPTPNVALAQSASGNFHGAGCLAHHCLGSASTNFSLSLSLSLFICKYSYPLCFLTPTPQDIDFRGSSQSYLQPFLWAGHEHRVPGILGLGQ